MHPFIAASVATSLIRDRLDAAPAAPRRIRRDIPAPRLP
jgi:hypothetical protein